MRRRFAVFTMVSAFAVALAACSNPPKYKYPETRKGDQVDDYHGAQVADPYRWLEDDNSEETLAWVKAQNDLTFDYLRRITFRSALTERLRTLDNYPKYGSPFRRGDYYFFSKNEGQQPQSVIYIQQGLDGEPEVLLDPNTFSADGTTRLSMFSVSKDAKYAAYGKAVGGGDWSEYYVMDIATRETLPDVLKWVKVSGASWAGDGFFYSRYPEPAAGDEITSKNENHQVYFHKAGTSQADDELVFEDAARPQRFNNVDVTEDERYAILSVSDRGSGRNGNALFVRDLRSRDNTFAPLVPEITDDEYNVIDNVGTAFLVYTNHLAPNGKVVRIEPRRSSRSRTPSPPAASSSPPTSRTSRPRPTCTRSTARSSTRSSCPASAPPAASAGCATTRSSSTPSPRSPIRRRSSSTTSRPRSRPRSGRSRSRPSTRRTTR